MKLWLLSQDVNSGYDTFDSFVVACNTAEEALNSLPSDDKYVRDHPDSYWTSDHSEITVKYLGEAAPGLQPGLICASFNAG